MFVLFHMQSMLLCVCVQAHDTGADRDDDKAQCRPKGPVQSNGHNFLAFQESNHHVGVTGIMCHAYADVVSAAERACVSCRLLSGWSLTWMLALDPSQSVPRSMLQSSPRKVRQTPFCIVECYIQGAVNPDPRTRCLTSVLLFLQFESVCSFL